MHTFVALLRGVMPTNPNTKSANLKRVFESLGLERVATVIGSGNIVFSTNSKNTAALEKKIERILTKELSFTTVVIVRSQPHLEALATRNPFKGVIDEKPNYLVVTFFKDGSPELCKTLNLTESGSPGYMAELEKKHGKSITTRTWKTVHRVLNKMHQAH